MEIKQLKYFLAVAEELNFHRAAKRLFISQPPLSRQIRLLEEELGVLLFDRIKKKTSLTDSGRALLIEAKIIIALTEAAKLKVQELGSGTSGTINISFVISGMMKFLPQWVKEFKVERPDVNIALSETAGTKNIVENLINNKTDISFTYGISKDLRIASKILYREKILYAIPEGHHLCDHEKLTLEMTKNEDYIFFPRDLDERWYDTFHELCRSKGFEPNVAHHAHPMQNRINMVAMGMGITFIAESLATLKTPGVVYKAPDESEQLQLAITVSYRKDVRRTLINAFLDKFDLKVNDQL